MINSYIFMFIILINLYLGIYNDNINNQKFSFNNSLKFKNSCRNEYINKLGDNNDLIINRNDNNINNNKNISNNNTNSNTPDEATKDENNNNLNTKNKYNFNIGSLNSLNPTNIKNYGFFKNNIEKDLLNNDDKLNNENNIGHKNSENYKNNLKTNIPNNIKPIIIGGYNNKYSNKNNNIINNFNPNLIKNKNKDISLKENYLSSQQLFNKNKKKENFPIKINNHNNNSNIKKSSSPVLKHNNNSICSHIFSKENYDNKHNISKRYNSTKKPSYNYTVSGINNNNSEIKSKTYNNYKKDFNKSHLERPSTAPNKEQNKKINVVNFNSKNSKCQNKNFNEKIKLNINKRSISIENKIKNKNNFCKNKVYYFK